MKDERNEEKALLSIDVQKKGADKFLVNRMCTFISICDEDVHFIEANKCQTEGRLAKQMCATDVRSVESR